MTVLLGTATINAAGAISPVSASKLSIRMKFPIVGAPVNGALSQTAGGALAATTYFVRSTWTTANGESLPAAETSLAVLINNVLNVAAPANPPSGATGWNVYVSTTTGTETKQNGGTPIALGTAWVEPTTGLVAGSALPTASTAFSSVDVEEQMPSSAWLKLDTAISADYHKVFDAMLGMVLRLNCTTFNVPVEYAFDLEPSPQPVV